MADYDLRQTPDLKISSLKNGKTITGINDTDTVWIANGSGGLTKVR